ncbi:MAG: Gfo/Idh/MocA family oxidoreductase [Bryobacterales bacterium]|nr:Gfo/Idh/MocA family oxidoreductase [Bryobacterales bacterium]
MADFPKSLVSRRGFVQAAGAASLLAQSAKGADERARVGFIGVGNRGFGGHVRKAAQLKELGAKIDLVAVCDVYEGHRERAADFLAEQTGVRPKTYLDYPEMLADADLDAVFIGTPDHWHAKMTIDALDAGLNVYCEKPMTKTVEEAFAVVDAWKRSGKVMQVGVQSTSLPVWSKANEMIRDGKLGKLVQFQTEFYRNTNFGQWRNRKLTAEMTPQSIDWKRWLGVEQGLAPEAPFDRTVFVQWRAYWPYGAGMYTDLFVHRTTSMLKATGLRLPGRVTGAGGIFYEYDGRDVPDVATVVADFNEGVQLIITASMVTAATPIKQIIRGHTGSFVFGNGEDFKGFDYVPEPAAVTGDPTLKGGFIEAGEVKDTTQAHLANFFEAIEKGEPELCNNPPDLGAAAVTTVNLGARSYREGKVQFLNTETREISTTDPGWAAKWEKMSRAGAAPNHVPGWRAGESGSRLDTLEHMRLGGPWVDGKAPESR